MGAIGGFLELEIPSGEGHYHDLIRLNSARNALKQILVDNEYKSVYLPIFTCDVVKKVIDETRIPINFYSINENFEPTLKDVSKNDLVIINNYFGVCSDQINSFYAKFENVLIDNAQAFFFKPIENTFSIYSARKFFGVPDGAYLYRKDLKSNWSFPSKKQQVKSLILPQLIRLESGPEEAYELYKKTEDNIDNLPICEMSSYTQKVLNSLNYAQVIDKRLANFKYLDGSLKKFNKLKLILDKDDVPYSYPLLIEKGQQLRSFLIDNKIFTPLLWPNVKEWADKTSIDYHFADNIVHLPIDQRYGKKEMELIIQKVHRFHEE